MSSILLYFFIAVGLSMDAFSLAIVYGANGISKNKAIIISSLVGIFHFIMPNLGNVIGHKFLQGFILYGNIITGSVFLFLTIQMLLSLKEKEEEQILNSFIEIILFTLAVSVDSFSVGIALSLESYNVLIASIIFSITSFAFTLTGFALGKIVNDKYGKYSKIIGIVILFIFSIKYFLNT